MQTLRNLLKINLLPEEKILIVQREHRISLALPLFAHFLLITCLVFFVLFFFYLDYPRLFLAIFVTVSMVCLSLLTVIGTILLMDWYFNFYIITDKRLIHEHFFRLSGNYYEEVFLENNVEYLERTERNILYNFLGIEDILVHFPSFDRETPFVFKSVSNPRGIERLIDEYSIKKYGQRSTRV